MNNLLVTLIVYSPRGFDGPFQDNKWWFIGHLWETHVVDGGSKFGERLVPYK